MELGYPKAMVVRYITERVTVHQTTIDIHIRDGRCPAPDINGPNGERLYSPEQVERVIEYWKGYGKYKRRIKPAN